jgi:O-antigen ligase
MFNKLLSYLSDAFLFLLIFSFFNDDFLATRVSESILKILFLVFYVFYLPTFIKNFKSTNTTQFKLIFALLAYLFTLLLIELLLDWNVFFAPAGSALIGIFSVLLFFSRYPVSKLIYMIWLSMISSVIMCYFNHPYGIYTFRTSGGTQDPNEFAMQLLGFLFVSIYQYTRNRSKLFLATTLLFFVYGIFKAGSMSSFLVLAIVGTINIIRFVIIKPSYLINIKVLLVIAILAIAAIQIDFTKIKLVQNVLGRTKDTGTAHMRVHSWIAGTYMVAMNPVIGVGGDSFAANERNYEEFHMIGSAPAPHNMYVKIIAESGIPAFLLFITFLVYIIKINFKFLFYNNEWFLLSALLAILLMGITLGVLYDKYPWLFVVLMMNINHQLQQKGYIT